MRLLTRLLAALLVGAVLTLVSSPHTALALDEFQKLTPADASANDNFGYSVAISGSTALIGAWKDDRPATSGEDTGSAYVYRDNGSGNWMSIDKLVASDAMRLNSFGSAVGIDGNTAVVGALFKNDTGGAYIFQDDGAGDWSEIAMLDADDGAEGDEFGYSAAISGSTAIVGAWKHNAAAGAAYLFRDNGLGEWSQIGKLVADDVMAGDHFGVSVAISGTTAIVGSYFDSNPSGAAAGAVYVFEDNGGTWSQVDKLLADDGSSGKQFGRSVALDGDRAVVGAIGDNTSGAFAGAAYVFERDETTTWQQIDKLLAGDGTQNDQFGISVSISGDNVVVGAFQAEEDGQASGSAYLFQETAPGSWDQVEELSAGDGASGDAFGYSVGISGAVGLVGAALNNSVATDAGAAYLFNAIRIDGDYNRNGYVDAADYVLWRKSFGQSGDDLPADGNGDETVDDADYQVWRANFGNSATAAAAQNTGGPSLSAAVVPEPGTAVLVFIAGLIVSLQRRC